MGKHIIKVRQTLWVWLILFSLSPCVVKQIVFDLANMEYARPTNRAKATFSVGSCEYSQKDNSRSTCKSKAHLKTLIAPTVSSGKPYFIGRILGKGDGLNPRPKQCNSPPKYIVYRCWKIYAV